MKYFADAPAVRRVVVEEGALTVESPSLEAMVFVKKTATILKRAISLRIYRDWFETTGLELQAFFTEHAVFRYVQALNVDRAPATRASAFCEAINFFAGIFDIDALAIRRSSRINGLRCKLLRTRQGVRQRQPLTVEMVAALENLLAKEVVDGLPASVDAAHAGAVIFGIFARARVGDLRRCDVEPFLDIDGGKQSGYVETRFYDHKTARPGTRRALPVCAPACGVTKVPWAELFVKARSDMKLNAEVGTLLPALGADGSFTSVSYSTPEFAIVIRHLLLKAGIEQSQLENVGAHSLKATCLSWVARFGLSRDDRRILGYHAEPGDRSVAAYARSDVSPALRGLERVLKAVRDKVFDPDCTRSGAFLEQAAVQVTAPDVAENTTDTDCSSSDGPDSDDEVVEISGKTEVLYNAATGFAHLNNLTDEDYTACGKPTPLKVLRLPAVPAGARLCRRCF